MRDLYITRSGTLKRKDNSLELITENDKWHIPINEIDSIHILSDIVINSDFLEFMNKN
ncbi:MAG: CRISPR-associated endonuclease Cas1, partial [Candidatus Aenigmarchaeota archaeon]|nr:CRISPR-associated endonuclease Cas1 [Candidatus Aenigmarchaeota archaeon]